MECHDSSVFLILLGLFVSVTNKPMNTLQQQFSAPKFRPAPDSQTNVVYKIPCANCSWCYIGETGRAFNTRRKEHLRNVKTAAKGFRIANHAWSHDHSIDFNNASVIVAFLKAFFECVGGLLETEERGEKHKFANGTREIVSPKLLTRSSHHV